MGNLLIETLKQQHGEPKRKGGKGSISPLRVYVHEHYEEIRQAVSEGYTYKQLVESISGIIGIKCSVGNFTYILSHVKKELDKGYLVTYKIGSNENTLWREFESKRDIEKFVENLALKAGGTAAYKYEWKILSMKKMTREEYAKRNNA